MQTLLKNSGQGRWYPESIFSYKNSIIIKGSYDEIGHIKSNFAYSMQYIEYLEKQISDLQLSSVLITMVYKSYIITGMGIIEALFTNLLRSTGYWNMADWKEYATVSSNPRPIDGKQIKVETRMLEKVKSYEMRMDLDSMIKKIESKKLLSIEHSTFPALKKLRELRNRVHLQVGEHATDHDYNKFNYDAIQMMRKILYTILTCDEFCNNPAKFQFLNRED